jgi:methionyl-tRNA formyltransferase
VVFGTPILKGAILNTAQKAMLNIHRGIVPQYKGGGITTWMLYNKDFDYSGVTIHMCTAALDAGDIVAQASYRIQKDDRIYTLRAKTTMLAAKLLKETINGFVQEKVTYTKQGQGRMWRSKDLDLGKEIMARRNLHQYLQAL